MQYTLLVNNSNPIKQEKIEKIKMDKYVDCDGEEILVERECLKSFLKLRDYFLRKDIIIEIDSAFRTIEYQKELMDRLEKEKGIDYIKEFVALPGVSEHHTGLALDITVKIDDTYLEENDMRLDVIYKEIHSVLYKYGFILRYPKDMENITGYSYEPWHIRYVGLIPARIIYENKLTLEEYKSKFGCVLYINKPVGITSYDVVSKISHLFGIKQVGHTGTLDPLASGVLIVCVGSACKIVELLTSKNKEYVAEVELGVKTDTLDITGNILDTCEVSDYKLDLDKFKKTYSQEVPIYSAVKVNGKKLYEYARNNIEVELPKKEVTIYETELIEEIDNKHFSFRCLVSKGCYIRSLIRDIGDSIGIYAVMSKLIRTKQGNVSIDDTNTLEEVEQNKFLIHKIEEVLDYPIIEVDSELEKKIRNGVKINNNWNISDKVMFVDNKGSLIGISEVNGDNLKTWKNF